MVFLNVFKVFVFKLTLVLLSKMKFVILSICIILCSSIVSSLQLFENVTCVSAITCSDHGQCVSNSSICVCDVDYASYECGVVQCCYERKSQSVAFFLSLFLGFVASGRWYIGMYIESAIQDALFALLLFVVNAMICCLPSNICVKCSKNIRIYVIVANVVMWMVYVIIFAIGDISDGNGVKLKSW